MEQLRRTSDKVTSCTQNVLCDPKYDRINDAILDIYAINLKIGAMALCTGIYHPLCEAQQPLGSSTL